jgi:two-component response regulator
MIKFYTNKRKEDDVMELDIVENKFSIRQIIDVIKAKNEHIRKLLTVKDRHSDAFVYVISGSCTYNFNDDQEFTVNAGDIFYLAHHANYTMYIHSDEYQFIFCDFEFENHDLKKSNIYAPSNASYAENTFRKLLYIYTHHTSISFFECMSILYDIYGIIALTASTNYMSNSIKTKITEAKEYIDTHFNDLSLSISVLADKLDISDVYFRKLFKSQYNMSPSKYINAIRINNAQRLMKHSFLSLETCALKSGFSSLQYFSRVFKKMEGISPGKYRKEKLND